MVSFLLFPKTIRGIESWFKVLSPILALVSREFMVGTESWLKALFTILEKILLFPKMIRGKEPWFKTLLPILALVSSESRFEALFPIIAMKSFLLFPNTILEKGLKALFPILAMVSLRLPLPCPCPANLVSLTSMFRNPSDWSQPCKTNTQEMKVWIGPGVGA